MKRFKTKKEFEEEFGPNWRNKTIFHFVSSMDPALGEPFNEVINGGGNYLPNCGIGIQDTWNISQDMLTDKPLLPIGTKVAIPKTKSIGDEDSYVFKCSRDYVYYVGVDNRHHMLWIDNDKEDGHGDYFSASEILEAHERYVKENRRHIEETGIDDRLKYVTALIDYGGQFTRGKVYKIHSKTKDKINIEEDDGGELNGLHKSYFGPSTHKEIKNYLIEEAKKRGFLQGEQFIALRDTIPGDVIDTTTIATSCNGEYHKKAAIVGGSFAYNGNTDTLYTTGYGIYVVYEKGKWADVGEKVNSKNQISTRHTVNLGDLTILDESHRLNDYDTIFTDEKQNKQENGDTRHNKHTGQVVKANRKAATITSGKRIEGCSISGRRGQATVGVGHLSYSKISCK
jgi:hypothetical protein